MPPRRRRPPRAGALSELPPLKIIRSILLLQISYYVSALILVLFTVVVFGQQFSINLIFDWNSVRGDNTLGWTIGMVWILTGFVTVIPLLALISRSKLVPDFALTIHLLHFIITSFYTKSIPTNLLWWGLQGASATLMISLGVWACRYREMQPISFGTIPSKSSKVGGVNNSTDDENVRGGRGKGKNVDGGPSYEMTNIGDDNV